nr:DnaJ domain protein [Calliteara abietis nucleopolyhedrovirus]
MAHNLRPRRKINISDSRTDDDRRGRNKSAVPSTTKKRALVDSTNAPVFNDAPATRTKSTTAESTDIGIDAEDDDDDNSFIVNNKARKFYFLYEINLNETDLYSIFQINYDAAIRFDSAFKQNLNSLYRLAIRTYSTGYQAPLKQNYKTAAASSIAVNDSATILDTIELGYSILSNYTSKRVYDNYLRAKHGKKYDKIESGLRAFGSNVEKLANRTRALGAETTRVFDNNRHVFILKEYLHKKINAMPQLRPTFLNRILINWTVHPNNTNNENVTVDVLRQYFESYGPVNDVVLCAKQTGCAILEFVQSSSVTKALNEKNKMYKLTELSKWRLTTETKAIFNNLQQKILEIENRLYVDKNELDDVVI